MKIVHLLFILFYLTIAASFTAAQTPRGTIEGVVTDDNGPVAAATISVKRQYSTDYNQIQNVSTNQDGRFTAHVEAGIYVVKMQDRCRSSRIENFEVSANKTATLNIKLLNEDCDQKEAEKMLEWKTCQQEASVAGLQLSDSDKAEIISLILDELLKFEDHFIGDNYREIIFSTENIDASLVKPFPNLKVSFLSPQKLQAKADSSKEGRIGYYAFSGWQPGITCAFIGISMQTAVSKNIAKKEEPGVFYCPVGTSKGYLFRKESGTWKMKQSRG